MWEFRLDEFWPSIKNSSWLGGELGIVESMERVPYWLDGMVPLAYLLKDEKLINKVKKAIDYIIINHQESDGWIGPSNLLIKTDEKFLLKGLIPWDVFPLMKSFTQYYEVTQDERIIPVLKKWFTMFNDYINENTLHGWSQFRWQDLLISLYWLYEKKPENWLLELAGRIERQGYDWMNHFNDLPFKAKCFDWAFDKHVVNHAMAIKVPGILYRIHPELTNSEYTKKIIAVMDKYHGQASGVFSGDECLAGKMPSRGTELCAVVEYMYSLEVLSSIFGDPYFGDLLEKITYNALPATFSPDMWTHQYVQQANQVVCCDTGDINNPNNRLYNSNGPRANLFGLEPHFPCCTANMHQGWPKFASHLWM